MIYKAIFHFDLDDERLLSIGLSNVSNLLKAVAQKPYNIILLFNGPAVQLITAERCVSHLEQIKALQKQEVSFKACKNAIAKFEITPEELIKNCEIVPAGVATLIEFQQEGYAYIKP